jgi:hypothetical protein
VVVGATYMCQGLLFGGVKQSGFGRFAGVEGLRSLCVPKVSCLKAVFGGMTGNSYCTSTVLLLLLQL